MYIMSVMFVQHFEPRGSRFTNFHNDDDDAHYHHHYYYYYYYYDNENMDVGAGLV